MQYTRELLRKFPTFAKPSYEAVIHNKVPQEYDLGVAIPYGKRAFLWFTFIEDKHICCIVEIGRNQQLQDNIHILEWKYPNTYALGTLLSGYLVDGEDEYTNRKYFIVDELFMYEGICFGNPFPMSLKNKHNVYTRFFNEIKDKINGNYSIHCIVMWKRNDKNELPLVWKENIGYLVKNIQYRCTGKIMPFGNIPVSKNPWSAGHGGPNIQDEEQYYSKKSIWNQVTNNRVQVPLWNINYHSPLFKRRLLFWVRADHSFDVYYLYVQKNIVYQHAYIPDYKTSVMMNKLFRYIPENENLDRVEESEDEDDFENIREDKYVDLQKCILMECIYNRKFKRWIPISAKPNHLGMNVPYIEDFLYNKQKNIQLKHNEQQQSYKHAPRNIPFQKRRKEKK